MVTFFREIEKKWQKEWERARIFEAERDEGRPKYFITFAYPYINGSPHLGHAYTFLKADVHARFKRMQGYNVLFGQGFHATGQPIVAAARLVREGDKKKIEELKMYGVKEEEIEYFKDPKHWIFYFSEKWREDLKAFGAAVDWRRSFITTELNPDYDAFIRWQYKKLREKGLVTRGKHPVVWCPKDKMPVGDHDRHDDFVGIVPEEIVVIKFKEGEKVFPTATYRPETVYGVTNLWVNPEGDYAEAEVDGERVIASKEWFDKLGYLEKSVKIVKMFKGKELVGRTVKNPVTGEEVPILPAKFVDTDFATGVVMSVPAHAPYDWIGVLEVDEKLIHNARSLIALKGYSEFPAKDVCEKYGVKSSEEVEKLDKATQELYKKEYYEGVLKDLFGKYAGKRVHEVKEEIIEEFIHNGVAEKVWILPKPVICRCGEKCVVKLVEQWFLKYSDEEWKKKTHEAVEDTEFVPEEVRKMVHTTIDWLRDWACTRDVKTSLGTRLPWDESQYIESLSDSTVYMAYYILVKYAGTVEFSEEVLDYVFYGIGSGPEEIRKDFEYWYPVDARFTGKDLIQNHLTFAIFHHAALFPGKNIKKWFVNGHVLLDGEKMSKSKGNVILLGDALEEYGVDATRFTCAYAGNTVLDDANIEQKLLKEMGKKLLEWKEFCEKWYGKGDGESFADRWLESKVNEIIEKTRQAYEEGHTRDIINFAWYDFWNVVGYYLKRCGGRPGTALNKALEVWVKLLHPIVPHITEEIWHSVFGKGNFLVEERFPEGEELNEEVIKGEEYVKHLLEDIKEVLKLAHVERPKKVVIVLAEEWKYGVFKKIKEALKAGVRDVSKILEYAPADKKKEVAQVVLKAIKDPGKIPEIIGDQEYEYELLKGAEDFLSKEVGLEVYITKEYDHPKAKNSLPFKPAIIVL